MVIFQRILIEFRRAVKRKKAITVVVFGIVVGAVVDATVVVSDVTTVVAVAAVVVVIVIGNVVVVVAATVDVHLSAINFLKYFGKLCVRWPASTPAGISQYTTEIHNCHYCHPANSHHPG